MALIEGDPKFEGEHVLVLEMFTKIVLAANAAVDRVSVGHAQFTSNTPEEIASSFMRAMELFDIRMTKEHVMALVCEARNIDYDLMSEPLESIDVD